MSEADRSATASLYRYSKSEPDGTAVKSEELKQPISDGLVMTAERSDAHIR